MDVMRTVPTALVAALTLVLGFAVAEVTGVRAIGGVVLVLGCGWCAWIWWHRRGARTAVGLTVVFLIAFAVSHPLGKAIGAWPSVVLVSAIVAAITFVVADRPRTATPIS